MLNRKLHACLMAIGLIAMSFGAAAHAQTVGPNVQAQNVSSAKRMASDPAAQLKAAGATMVPQLPMPKQLAASDGAVFVCGDNSCACRGPRECMDMIKLRVCAPKTTTCTQPASTDPYCRCDKK